MLCSTIKSQVRTLLREFDSYIDAHIDTALQITTELRAILVSPVADILTAIIPGDIDNEIRQQLITALGKAIEALTIADNCKQYTEVDAMLNCFVQQLQQRDPEFRDAVLQKMASLLAATLDGQRLKQNLYDLYTQAKYTAAKA